MPRTRLSLARCAAAAALLALGIGSFPSRTRAQGAAPAPAPAADARYVVEYYYKARWGAQQEFLELFRRNHLPLLLGRVRRGTMSEVTAVAPRYHATEGGRWDYRVTIVFPSVAAAHTPDPQEEADRRRLFPDSARYAAEERRRFEALEAHWDVPLVPVALAGAPAAPAAPRPSAAPGRP